MARVARRRATPAWMASQPLKKIRAQRDFAVDSEAVGAFLR